MKVALTGATGFVGRHALSALVGAGHDVVALCRDPSRVAIPAVGFDLTSEVAPGVLRGFDAVLHLATFRPPALADPTHARMCIEVNALGTLSLARAARDAGVGVFVHTSAGNAYAWEDRPVRESDPLYPARAPYYLQSKVDAEVFADHVGRDSTMRVVALRPSSIYGPQMGAGLIPALASCMKSNQRVTLRDGGSYAVDLVHVGDVVRAALRAFVRPVQGPFNVGAGCATTTSEVARLLAEIIGVDTSTIDVVPPGASGPDRGFAPLDITRARADLDYAPTALVDGLRVYIDSLG